jgi:transcriptional regulator with XRE-family HTH domain
MTEPARRRVSEALTCRMRALQLTTADLAAKAHVAPTTIRGILRGARWPRLDTRRAIEVAVGWPTDEFVRLAVGGLHDATCDELRAELGARCSGT